MPGTRGAEPRASDALADLAARIRRIEDRQEIEDLVRLYFYVMDERDLDSLPRIFTDDAFLGSGDGVFNATGLDTIAQVYGGRFSVLGPTFHYSHGSVTRFSDNRPDEATGVLTGHAEIVREGVPTVVALRYEDTYRRTAAGWRIARRVMSYFYYCAADDYAEVMRTVDRNRAYDEPHPADWPSALHGGDLGWLRGLTGGPH